MRVLGVRVGSVVVSVSVWVGGIVWIGHVVRIYVGGKCIRSGLNFMWGWLGERWLALCVVHIVGINI